MVESPSSTSKPTGSSAVRPHFSSPPASQTSSRLTGRNRLLFFLTAWLIVLMPFLFWWSTWFGRPLSDKQIDEYVSDERHPRHMQHALVQLGERMSRQDPGAKRWYPQIVQLATYRVEEVRNTDAWVMGQDTSNATFHDTLLKMLNDPAITVRGNAALSLVRFGDPSGRLHIAALLQPARVTAPSAGRILDIDKTGTSVHQAGLIAKLLDGQRTVEVRSPIGGRVHQVSLSPGMNVSEGAELAVVSPTEDQVWEALRAMYFVGQAEDLAAIRTYQRELPDISDRVRQQAVLTEKAILDRTKREP